VEVQFTPDKQAKLSRIAAAQGLATEALVQEAVDRLLSQEEWFSQEVEHGLAASQKDEFVEHDDVRRMIDSQFPA